MRPRDLLPLALLGGIAAFIGVQAARRPAAPATVALPNASVEPQGATAEPAPTTTVTTSASPLPERDEMAIQIMLRDGSPGTYLPAMLEQQNRLLTRWPERQREAIRVWIERDAKVDNWDPSYPVVAERAFDEWREAGFPLRFDVVHDRATTELRIRFVSQFEAAAGRRIGVTHLTRDQNGWLVDAEIVIATHDAQGRALAPSLIAGVARHEVGHALGLAHSPSPADVMFPESTTPVISARDRATLNLLYRLPPGVMK